MPENKLTWSRGPFGSIQIEGSLRMPTLVEIYNYALENPELGAILKGCWLAGANFGNGFLDPQEYTKVELYEADDLRRRLDYGYRKQRRNDRL